MRRIFGIGNLAGIGMMTSPAAHLVLARKVGLIDEPNHAKHFPRSFFCGLVILVPFKLGMAVSAGNAEAAAYCIHCDQHLCCRLAFEYLNAFEDVFCTHWAIHAKP